MKVDLNPEEIKVIETALDLWEREQGQKAFIDCIFDSIAGPRDEFTRKREIDAKFAMIKDEELRRKRVSVLLRAKLYQCDAQISEHNV